MKITTWNVNGLRAALGKGIFSWVSEYQPDVLCLQEVRSKPSQIDTAQRISLEATFSHITWNPAARPGYSGVATLTNLPPREIQLGLGSPEFDSEGRVICARYPGFLLFNIYFPHGGHDLSRVPFKLDFYARLLELYDELRARGEEIILCGDFNTAHQEIDLRNPKENEGVSGFLTEERVWVDYYLEHGLVDIYRRLYPERVQYTWWTYRFGARARNIGWRLDYFMVSEELINQVQDVIIHEEVTGSDHCPVTLLLEDRGS
jgi:exodeoxyribonuclease-3